MSSYIKLINNTPFYQVVKFNNNLIKYINHLELDGEKTGFKNRYHVHKYGTPIYTWSEDGSSCMAKRVCIDNENHIEIEFGTITSDVKTDATCTEMGTTTYTAAFTNEAFTTQTKDIINIDPLWHDYSNATFTWNGTNCTVTATCSRCGKTYTQTSAYDSKICATPCTTTDTTVPVKYVAFFKPDESLPLYSIKDGTEAKTDDNVLHTPTGYVDTNIVNDYNYGSWRCSKHENITNIYYNGIGTTTANGNQMVWYVKDNVCYLYGSKPNTKMNTYGARNQPWYPQRNYIHKVFLDKSITKFEPSGFYPCQQVYQFMADINHPVYVGGKWSYFLVLKEGNIATVHASGSKLQKLTIPAPSDSEIRIDGLGDNIFAANGVIEEVDAKYITSIGKKSFYGSRIKKFNFGDALTSVGESAFESCTLSTYIYLGRQLKVLPKYAFKNCYNLSDMSLLEETPLEVIEEGAFSLCSSLSEINLPSTLKKIEKEAFIEIYEMTSITIPNTVEEIGENAFKDIPHIYYNGTATGSPWGALAIN